MIKFEYCPVYCLTLFQFSDAESRHNATFYCEPLKLDFLLKTVQNYSNW